MQMKFLYEMTNAPLPEGWSFDVPQRLIFFKVGDTTQAFGVGMGMEAYYQYRKSKET